MVVMETEMKVDLNDKNDLKWVMTGDEVEELQFEGTITFQGITTTFQEVAVMIDTNLDNRDLLVGDQQVGECLLREKL